MSALRWGIRPHAGRWLVGYVKDGVFMAQRDCPTLPSALTELAEFQEART